MSRYYRIVVAPSTEAQQAAGVAAPSNTSGVWTNRINNACDTGAQMIEMDLQVGAYDSPSDKGASWVRIWGPTKEQISQASNYNGSNIQIFGGMQPGLPLATEGFNNNQSGLLISGLLFQAFGNWQGLTQTLEFIIKADGSSTQAAPGNFLLFWKKGQTLASALQNCLQIAYPNSKINISISSKLVLPADEPTVHYTLPQLSNYVKMVSKDIYNDPDYQGVSISIGGGTINVFDGTVPTSINGQQTEEIQILEQDLIGSPTWQNANTIQFTTVMRADLTIGSEISLPAIAGLQAITNVNSQSYARAADAFDGTWIISDIRHVGNSRQGDAQSWVSVFQAYTQNTAAVTDSPEGSDA